MSRTPGPPRSSAGRPRDQQIDQAVLNATLELLTETGYPALTLEEVARRAGTTRPTIYRRWDGRVRLVLAAITSRLHVPEPPDTGCTLCDLDESFGVLLAAYRTIRPDVLNALYVECATDADLRAEYLRTVVDPARDAVGRTLGRARERGDLRPDADLDQLLDMVAALVHYRAVFDGPHLSPVEAAGAVELLLRGAAVDYAALVEHSRAVEHDGHGQADVHESS